MSSTSHYIDVIMWCEIIIKIISHLNAVSDKVLLVSKVLMFCFVSNVALPQL